MDLLEVRPGLRLAVDRWHGDGGAPFVLVHGLSSNARLWDGVAARLADAGHPVVAVDQRGHGRSDRPDGGYDTPTATDDLRLLLGHIGLDRPVIVGQSWGGHVALELAAAAPDGVRGVATVDGGLTELRDRFPDWDACRTALTPPDIDGMPFDDLRAELEKLHPGWPDETRDAPLAGFDVAPDGTVRRILTVDHHMSIVRSMWERRPLDLFPRVPVPVLLVPAEERSPWSEGRRREVAAAEAALPTVRVRWLEGEHDLHAQRPDDVARVLHDATSEGFFS